MVSKPASVESFQEPIYRLFKDRPTVIFSDSVREHVKITGTPETFVGLHSGPISKSERFFKLAPIDIDRRKRPNGDLAPCPMCQPNKFLSGFLVWFVDLQAVGVIGNCCADKETADVAEREWKWRAQRDFDESYLLKALPLVSARKQVLAALLPAAEHADRTFRHFRRHGGQIHDRLREASNQTGVLSLVERIDGDLGLQKSALGDHRLVNVGRVAGMTALLREYRPIADLNQARSLFDRYDGGPTESEAVDFIISLTEEERRKLVILLQAGEKAYARFASRLEDFGRFFEPDNIALIHRWGCHELNDQSMQAFMAKRLGFEIVTFQMGKATVALRYDIAFWENRPVWPVVA